MSGAMASRHRAITWLPKMPIMSTADEEVYDDNGDGGDDHGLGSGPADALRSAFGPFMPK